MEPEEIIALTEKDEPWVIDIYQNNEKYYIGTISIYPRKIRDALCKLYDDGETKLFSGESEEESYLEKLRNAPLNSDENKFSARQSREVLNRNFYFSLFP